MRVIIMGEGLAYKRN